VCMVALLYIPAVWIDASESSFSRSLTWSTCCDVESSKGAFKPSFCSSAGSFLMLPGLKMTRPGLASYSKASITLVIMFELFGQDWQEGGSLRFNQQNSSGSLTCPFSSVDSKNWRKAAGRITFE